MKKNLVVLGLCSAVCLFAQGPPPGRGMGPGRGGPGGPMGPTIAGAPYSAIEVSESTQTLPNGNVISQKSQTNVFRDGMGRVRTETTIPQRGPGVSAGAAARTVINIHDPVAAVNRQLDIAAKVVNEMPLPGRGTRGGGGPNPAFRGNPPGGVAPNVTTEALSMQTINGIQATGVRATRTIPAGEIGNAQAIQTVREVWAAVDLQVPVMVKEIDPRFGTTTTQLTNITRSEPDPALFQIPTGYTVTRGGRGPGGPAGNIN